MTPGSRKGVFLFPLLSFNLSFSRSNSHHYSISPPQALALSPCSPKPGCGDRSGLSIPAPALPQIYQCHYTSASVAGAPAQAHSLPKSCPCALLWYNWVQQRSSASSSLDGAGRALVRCLQQPQQRSFSPSAVTGGLSFPPLRCPHSPTSRGRMRMGCPVSLPAPRKCWRATPPPPR